MADALTPEAFPLPGPPAPDDSKSPVTNEVATALRNYFEPVYQGLLSPQDDTLLTRGGGKGLKTYDELERDPHCFSVLQKRKLSLIAREWAIEPGGKRAIDKAAAETVTNQLKAMPFDRICVDLLDAVLKGFSVGEVMWEIDGREIKAVDVRARNQRRFVFDVDQNLRLLTQQQPTFGIPVPERKFIVHRYGSKDRNPYGLGLGTRLFWPVFFKRQGIQFWLTFCDKFGNPTAIGRYPAGAGTDSKNMLARALAALSQESGIAIPIGMEISLLEAQKSGATGTYEGLCHYMDEEMSKAVLGETMSTSHRGGGGGLGSSQASVQNEVRLEITKADADLLSASLSQTLVRWIAEYNHPGAAIPRVFWDVSEPTDLLQRAQADQIVYGMGFEPDLDYIQQTYGAGWKQREIPPPPLPGAIPPAAGGPQFSAPSSGPDAIDAMTRTLAQGSDAALLGWTAAVRKVVDEAKDLADLRERLISAYPQMSLTELATGMQAAFAAAQLAGRYDILQEARR